MSHSHADKSPWIIDTTDETFERDVFQQSRERPIVVDFWAAWCAPCRLLGPVLETLAREYDGRFVLAKANTDEVPAAAARFNVQGIPAVFGLVNEEIVDYFAGALPEGQIRGWLERLLSAAALAAAQRLEASDAAAAEAKYRALVEQAPADAKAQIGLARVLLAQEKMDECREVVDQLQQRGFLEPEAEKIRAALDLHSKQGEDVEQRRASAKANPDDLGLQLQLAEALAGDGQYEQALQACLRLVERDKQGVGDKARELMIEVFRVLPDDSPLTSQYRRKLSMLLY